MSDDVETEVVEAVDIDASKELPSYAADELESLTAGIVDALKLVFDPEIPVNIYDLGLIYDVALDTTGFAEVKMTLTAPGCPVAQTFPQTVCDAVCSVEGVRDANVELVWEPPWTQELMSEAARYQLNMF